MSTDAELLHRYAATRDEPAFAELVRRHLGLVHAAALRRTNGRAHLAEEVAQQVFCDLARKAAILRHHPTLAGWLYRSTRYAVIDATRAELRRAKLAQSLATMPDTSAPSDSPVAWENLRPVLDEALDRLGERDRELMLLRYFNGLTFAEVGARLGLSENAARMRTERALGRLRADLAGRGVTSTAAALGLLLASQSLAAAPAGLAATVTTAAVAIPPTTGLAGLATALLMSKLTAPALSAALAAGLTTIVWTSVARTVSAAELSALQQENSRLTQAAAASAATATADDDLAINSAAISQAMARKQSVRAAATANNPGATAAATGAGRHCNRGQATAHDAYLSFAWADDAAEIGELAKLICFEPEVRAKALAVHATMPESLRTQYPTPEELYAFFFAADALVAPPPGADVLEKFVAVELSPGRVAMRPPGSTRNHHIFRQTAEGWKWEVPAAAIASAPKVISNKTLEKLGSP